MKKTIKLKAMPRIAEIIALIAVIVFSMAALSLTGCDGDDDPTSATYTSYDASGNSYTLVITKDTNRAAYVPQSGDTYELTVKNPAGTVIARSTGTVTVNSGSSFTLTPGSGSPITITISGDGIGSISGTIPGTGGNSGITDPAVTPNNPNSGNLSGTYSRTDINEYGTITTSFTFSGNNNYTFKVEGFDDPEDNETFDDIYTLNGDVITFVFPINDEVVSTCIARLSADRNSFTIKKEDQEPLDDPEDEEDFLFGTYTKQ